MPYDHLRVYLEEALFRGGLSIKEAELASTKIIPGDRSRTFLIGRVDPFKIDFYRKSLGIVLKADGSHPEHIEVDETYPAWIRPLLEANIEIAKNLKSHVAVMKGIENAVDKLAKILERLEEKI